MRTSKSSRWLTLFGAAVFSAAMLVVSADEAEAQEVFFACYMPGSGVVYRVAGTGPPLVGRSGKSGNLAASTARFASEYRKLATAAGDGEIGLELVESSVEDRGQEDVWKILDAIGAGKVESAISRLRRLLDASDDPIAARLSFFSLLAEFVRHLTAVSGIVRMLDVPRGVQNYGQFKAKIAPALQADLDGDLPNPLAGLHPFRLHKAYLIAGKMSAASLDTWPWRLLEAELQLKGESGQPEVVLFRLLTEVALAK